MSTAEEKELKDRIDELEFDVENANRSCRFIATLSLVAVTVITIEFLVHRQPCPAFCRPF